MTGQYEELQQHAGALGCKINNATDTLGLLHCIHETKDISGGRQEELIEFLIHLLACAKTCRDNRIMTYVKKCELYPGEEKIPKIRSIIMDSNFTVICPFCGKINSFTGDDWSDELIDDSCSHIIPCLHCGKEIEITVNATYILSAEKPEEE